jgi:transcriptional regulator with XRE-family HTH domain
VDAEADAGRHIGHRIRMLRVEQGRSVKDIARSANLDPTQLSKIERGHSDPRVSTVKRIARALDVAVGILFDETDPMKGRTM